MRKLVELIREKDEWMGAEGERDGLPFLLRYRPHLQDFISTKNYNKRITISWAFASDHWSSMPTNERMELWSKIEDALVERLEIDVQSVLAFVYTWNNQREWHWYSTDVKEFGRRLNDALTNFDKLPIELNAEEDAEWLEYQSVLEGGKEAKEI